MCIINPAVKGNLWRPPLFTPFTFTNMGATGLNGPSTITYANPPYSLNLVGGIQYVTIYRSGIYTFTVAGAGNTNSNSLNGIKTGYGMVMTRSYTLLAGTVLAILVGQMGIVGASDNRATGGSGGTFVATVLLSGSTAGATLLFAAGGSGGVGFESDVVGNTTINGTTNGTGQDGGPSSPLDPTFVGAGGAGPNGGAVAVDPAYPGGNGGAGFSGNGAIAAGTNAKSFINGGLGGTAQAGADGGFGGGGGGGIDHGGIYPGGGGGGGYGGGGGGGTDASGAGGGGGGSYDITGTVTGTATNSGMGYVTITYP